MMKTNLRSARNILTLCSMLCGVFSILFYTMLCSATEYYFLSAAVYAVLAVTLVIQAAGVFLGAVEEKEIWKDAAGILPSILYMAGLMVFINGSIEWIQHLLSKDNVPGFSNMYVVSVVFLVLSSAVQIAANFTDKK